MKKLFVWWIPAEALWPVCEAGAVVIARTPKRALALVPELYKPGKPEKIGNAFAIVERVVNSNNGQY